MGLPMDLIENLPPVARLALAYAPAPLRPRWLTLLALDARLGQVVQQAREPMLGQLKLAWWRDRLAQNAQDWPKGEPLLSALGAWGGEHGVLSMLVDGWEAVLADGPLSALGEGRGAALIALCTQAPRDLGRLAHGWALADLAPLLADRPAYRTELAAVDWHRPRLPKAMRPLLVLHGAAQVQAQDPTKMQKIPLLRLMRLGMFGF